jgi:hypothetical protein
MMLGCLLLTGWSVFAVPASDLPFVLKQPGGACFEARVRGDDVFSWYETTAGFPIN